MLGLGNTILNNSVLGGPIATDFAAAGGYSPFDYPDTRFVAVVLTFPQGGSADQLLQFSASNQNSQLTAVTWTLKVDRMNAFGAVQETSQGQVYGYRGGIVSGGTLCQIFFSDDNSSSIVASQVPGTPFAESGSALLNIETFGGVNVTDGTGSNLYRFTLTGVASGYQDLSRISPSVTMETI